MLHHKLCLETKPSAVLFCTGPTSSECNLMVSLRGLDLYCPSLPGFQWTPAPKVPAVQCSCISKRKYIPLCIKRSPDMKPLLSQKGRIKSHGPDVCPGQDTEISQGTCIASQFKFWTLLYWAESTHGKGTVPYSSAWGEML